jgi:hypothetical protein
MDDERFLGQNSNLYSRRPISEKRLEPPNCLTMKGLKNHFKSFFSSDELLDVVVKKSEKKVLKEK